MPRIHVNRIAVADDAIDQYGHVGNLTYLGWMQDAATAHSAAQGWTLERYRAAGAGWFVRSHFIEYLRPAVAGDALTIRTWVADIAARSSTRRYLFVRAHDGQRIARAETLWVWVDFATGRPARIPAEVAASFPVVADDDPEVTTLDAGAQRRGD